MSAGDRAHLLTIGLLFLILAHLQEGWMGVLCGITAMVMIIPIFLAFWERVRPRGDCARADEEE